MNPIIVSQSNTLKTPELFQFGFSIGIALRALSSPADVSIADGHNDHWEREGGDYKIDDVDIRHERRGCAPTLFDAIFEVRLGEQ